jgi:hypothetical protein
VRGDPQPLLGEPGPLQLFAAADGADHRVGRDLDRVQPDRRVAVGIAVGEAWVVDDLHAAGLDVDQEEGGEALVAFDHVGHHDQDRGDVAGGDEPLLAVQHVPVVARLGGGEDPGRIGTGVALGDRVGVAQLAAQRRAQVALGLFGAGVGPDVVGVGDVPVDRVGAAPELLGDQRPLHPRPVLPAVLAGVQAAAEVRRQRLALDQLDLVRGQAPVRRLGLLLERDQHLVGEATRALLQIERCLIEGQSGHRSVTVSCD